jgi:uncharacterized surface protein with fasciclin (FAS1) repeats
MSTVVSEAGYFMVSPSNTSPVLTDPEQAWNPGYYRTAHNDKVQGAAIADYAFNVLGLTQAASIHDGDPYTEGLANSFAVNFEELGGEIVEFTAINKGDTDMRPVLTSIAAAGPPEFLYFPIFMPECALMVKQMKEVSGLEETVPAAADGCISADAAEAIGEDAAGMYWSGPDIAFAGDEYEQFKADYLEKYGTETLSVFHAHAFDATNIILGCVEEVAVQDEDGTIHVGRQAMRDCVGATSGFSGITGTLTCDEYGDCADPKISISIVEEGEYTKIWPEEEAAEGANTIVDIAVADGRFTTLVTALQEADLVEALQAEGPFTVFAPTDDAFAALPEGTLEDLLADKDALTNVLLYHVLEGKVMSAQAIELAGQEVSTLSGDSVALSLDGEILKVNDAVVIIADIEASNGVIHVIDAVLVP